LVPGASNRTLRRMLQQRRVRLNGRITTSAGVEARSGDVVEIGKRVALPRRIHNIDILTEDDAILVVHKPAGLLTVATPHESERTAYAFLREYVKQQDPARKLFIVHRLDKFVSGLLVFAKSERVKLRLQALFQKHQIQRKYWAIVEGRVELREGTVRSHLAEDRFQRMRSTKDTTRGKEAVTHYRVLRRFSNLTSLEVTLETGRKNQIRAHLSEIGHPIVGDRAYGSRIDPLGRMGLHAYYLGFTHPTLSIPAFFETEPPPEFRRYLPTRC